MKNIYKYLIAVFLIFAITIPSIAGNDDRSGEAGASQLLINPWAQSSGWGGVNVANVNGLDAIFVNVAGLAFVEKFELGISQVNWLEGAGVTISTAGFATQFGEGNTIAVKFTSMGFGDIIRSETENPDTEPFGGIGTFSPTLTNVSLSYAKAFSNSIYSGITVRYVGESIAEVRASGICFDAGVQYVTGDLENIKFGLTLKNLSFGGMKYSGDGMSIRAFLPGQTSLFTTEHRAAKFKLPSQLNIGGSYDFLFEDNTRFTLAGNFNSNSFTKDQYTLGAEFAFKNFFMIRAAYTYEDGINEKITADTKTNVSRGLSAGATVHVPFSRETGTGLSIHYSYRATDHFSGSNTFGATINM